jgi:hypothetical protein
VAASHLLGHHSEQHESVAHADRIGVREVELVLAVAVLVIE